MIPTPEKNVESEKKHSSKGERLFNWITYGGIAGVAVFLGGLPTAYRALYHDKGFWRGLYTGSKKLAEGMGFTQRVAEDIAITNVTMQPGNIAIPFVMAAEHYKPQIVGSFNKALGEPVDESVKQKPKQTLGSIVKGRLLAWTAAFSGFTTAGFLFLKTFDAFKKEFAERFCKLQGKPTHEMKEINGIMKRVETKAFRYGNIASLDIFATTVAATLLYLGSHFFAGMREKKKHSKEIPSPEPVSPVSLENAVTTVETMPPRRESLIQPRPGRYAEAALHEKAAKADASPALPFA